MSYNEDKLIEDYIRSIRMSLSAIEYGTAAANNEGVSRHIIMEALQRIDQELDHVINEEFCFIVDKKAHSYL